AVAGHRDGGRGGSGLDDGGGGGLRGQGLARGVVDSVLDRLELRRGGVLVGDGGGVRGDAEQRDDQTGACGHEGAPAGGGRQAARGGAGQRGEGGDGRGGGGRRGETGGRGRRGSGGGGGCGGGGQHDGARACVWSRRSSPGAYEVSCRIRVGELTRPRVVLAASPQGHRGARKTVGPPSL